MRATKKGESGAKVVINQAAPTSCIQVPIVDTADANHKARNTGCRRGFHIDVDTAGAVIRGGKRGCKDSALRLPWGVGKKIYTF
jgi:hypothetical protein